MDGRHYGACKILGSLPGTLTRSRYLLGQRAYWELTVAFCPGKDCHLVGLVMTFPAFKVHKPQLQTSSCHWLLAISWVEKGVVQRGYWRGWCCKSLPPQTEHLLNKMTQLDCCSVYTNYFIPRPSLNRLELFPLHEGAAGNCCCD